VDRNFGTLSEDDKPATHRFVVFNTGKTPLHVISANASCGCTTPAFSKDPIAAADSGFVEVTFNPSGRPGAFKKTVTVTTDAEQASYELTITGTVTPHVKTALEAFPDTLGHGLRIVSRYLNMGDVSPSGSATTATFVVLNSGKAPCGLKPAKPLPAWLKMKLVPAVVQPGQQGMLHITYHGKKRHDLGYIDDPITLQTTGPAPSRQTQVFVIATVQEISRPLSAEELAKHGHLTVQPDVIQIGSQPSGRVYTSKVELSNTGKAPIKIYGVKGNCRCINTELISNTLAPGQKTELYIHFDAHGYVQEVAKAITIYSTDLAHPAYSITLKANLMPLPGQEPVSVE
jgi:hypothetical protein